MLCLLGALLVALPQQAASEQASQPMSPAAAGLDAGRDHTCALVGGGGSVRCWGWAANGRLGYANGNVIGDDETPGSVGPVNLGAGRAATALAAGDAHTCARLDDATVRCWGLGADGQLGYGNRNTVGDNEPPGSAGPVNIGSGRTAVAIAAGAHHTCAVLDGGDVRCWGSTFYGQIGYPRTPAIGDDEAPGSVGPLNLGDGRTATAITGGVRHTCALLDGGAVRCWGDATAGQLGYGNTTRVGDDEAPGSVDPVDLGAGRSAIAISAGDYHSCALLDNGSVSCWGYGSNGQLGYGNTRSVGDDETPASVGTVDLGQGRTATAISAGGLHTCALLDDRTVRCWGDGAEGRLGYGNARTIGDDESPGSAGPVNLGTGRRAIAISAGGAHTCARLDDASVRCWGHGANGRLGLCGARNIGDDETPGAAGPVRLTPPAGGGTGCPRPAGQPARSPVTPTFDAAAAAGRAQAARMRGFRSCLAKVRRHARREIRRARLLTGTRRAGARDHAARHKSRLRRRCLKRWGRTPGRVTGLKAVAVSRSKVVLTFTAPGTDGSRPPAAKTYVVKQSRRPIRGARAFRRARALCNGSCRFPSITRVGGQLTLAVTDLRPGAAYYYAVAARDNVSRLLGRRSRTVRVRTP